EPDPARMAEFRQLMDDDLDTPHALALVFGLVTEINRLLDASDHGAAAPLVAAWRQMLGAVGLEVSAEGDEVPDEIAALARRRDEARAAKDWTTADALRDELVAAGWTVEDSVAGTQVRRG